VVTENDWLRLPIHQNILARHLTLWSLRYTGSSSPLVPLILPAPNIQHQAQCDPGVNISTMKDINILRGTVSLENPFPISSANRTAPAMMVSVSGTFVHLLSDGSTCDIPMYYCPSLSDTIVSPQHFKSSAMPDSRYNGYCLIDMPSCCRILLSPSNGNDAPLVVLQKINDLYFIDGSTPGSSGTHVSHLATKTQLMSELCHQCLGRPGPTQLSLLVNHSTGLLSQLTAGLHPMHSCQACNDPSCSHGSCIQHDSSPVSNSLPSRFWIHPCLVCRLWCLCGQ
jgi:hypothetical protein